MMRPNHSTINAELMTRVKTMNSHLGKFAEMCAGKLDTLMPPRFRKKATALKAKMATYTRNKGLKDSITAYCIYL